jgi:hypothetical protein
MDCSAAEILAVNPFGLRLKPLRGFGGVTTRPAAQKMPPCPFKAMPMCFDHGG